MDNFHIDVTSEGDADLRRVLEIALAHSPGGGVAAFKVTPKVGLVLCWSAGGGATPFGFALKLDALFAYVREWLGQQDYGSEPDHDGDNEKGWRAYNEQWGHVGGDAYAFLAIQPAWAMYGK